MPWLNIYCCSLEIVHIQAASVGECVWVCVCELSVPKVCEFPCTCKFIIIHKLYCRIFRTQIKKYFENIVPPYRCNKIGATCVRRIEKQMRAHPCVWLGHGSKDTAHVCIDTSKYYTYMIQAFYEN